MKKTMIALALFASTNLFAQTISKQERQEIIKEIRKEILDSLKNNPNLIDEITKDKGDTAKRKSEPFAWGDFSWVQGNNRQKNSLLKSKYFTGGVTIDCNYNYNFVNPIDHTNSGSTATFRSNEFNLSYIEAGGEFYEPKSGARAKLMLQFGSRATGIPRNDNTPLRGQFDLYNALRYVTEGYAGIHLNKMHGINIDFGIFKSYVGLLSYNIQFGWIYP